MNLLTVARRAKLGSNIHEHFTQAQTRLKAGASYSKAIYSARILNPAEHEFFESSYVTGLVSIAEGTLVDFAIEYLACYPGHLSEKTLSLDQLDKTGSIAGTIAVLAEKNVHDWSYHRFSEFVVWALALFDKKATLSSDVVASVSELKATRDVYVHNNGRINKIYLNKAGALARSSQIGAKLDLGSAYLADAEKILGRLLSEFYNAIPNKIKEMGKATAFREMWNATCLARMVPFEEAWRIETPEMVRPQRALLEWGWSHSEKMLLDFFLGVYADHHEARQYDLMDALRRWSPESNEGKVIASWSNDPFWF